jgi:hypothetical protein
MCGEVCGDNRFELIEKYKQYIINETNISTSPDEMKVLDDILFRLWQLDFLDNLELLSKIKKAYTKYEGAYDNDEETKYWYQLGDLLDKIKEV